MAEVEMIRGSDKDFIIRLKDANEDPIDITGRVLTVFDVSRTLTGRVTAEITDAAAGEMSVHVEGTLPLPLGLHSFRIQLTAGTASIAVKPIQLRVV